MRKKNVQTKESKTDFSSGGVVFDPKSKSLLVVYVENLKGKKIWTFPKGHPEGKETDQEAALREVREETGWDCKIEKPLMDVRYIYVHEEIKVKKTVRWFLMTPVKKSGDFDPGEIIECQWAPLEDIPKLITYVSDKKLLKKTLEVI